MSMTGSGSGSLAADDNPCAADAFSDYDYPMHIAAIFILMGVSFIGSGLPVLGSRFSSLRLPEIVTKIGRAFGTGVILATSVVHMLPPAMEALTSPCITSVLSEDYTAFAGAVAMISILLIQLIEFCVTSYYEDVAAKSSRAIAESIELKSDAITVDSSMEIVMHNMPDKLSEGVTAKLDENSPPPEMAAERHHLNGHSHGHHHGHHSGSHGHSHFGAIASSGKQLEGISDQLRGRIVALLLEIGIAFHSVIIGISLGVLAGGEFTSLLIALCFHQFFEGFALASTVVDAGFDKLLPKLSMILFYTLTTPTGVAIGVGIASSYDANSPTALITQGVFDSISAGILLYMALVELLSYQYTNNPSFKREPLPIKCLLFACIYIGAGGMAMIGRWA